MNLLGSERRRILKSLTDVFGFEDGILLQDIFDSHAVGDEVHDKGHSDSHAPNARPTSHDSRVERYAIESRRVKIRLFHDLASTA